MGLKVLFSRLADPASRRSAERWLLAFTALGFIVTLLGLARGGAIGNRWFFAAVVWVAFLYIPLRILLEVAGTWGRDLRRSLTAEIVTRADRYGSPAAVELVVDYLFGRDVVMPHIAQPMHTAKVKEAAAGVLTRATRRGDTPPVVEAAAITSLAVVARWVERLAMESAVAQGGTEPIQTQWAGVRAAATLAALTTVLLAAYQDMTDRPLVLAGVSPEDMRRFLDDCLDFCDQMALNLEGPRWQETAFLAAPTLEETAAAEIMEAWRAYCSTPPPAPTALRRFLDTVVG